MKEMSASLRGHSSRILSAGIVLTFLYLGRWVLIPLALAIMLSLLVAPLVRTLGRLGIGRVWAVLLAVGALILSGLTVAGALGTQIVRIAERLPQYESNVQHKLKILDEATVGRLRLFTSETNHLIELEEPTDASRARAPDPGHPSSAAAPAAVALGAPDIPAQPLQLMWKLLRGVWGPIQFAGIVLLVLIFVLLEHESLRDRFIRIAGATGDIRPATFALNDAGERLSRYFVSQFTVNLAFGAAIWLSLSLLHLPEAMLCGILAGVMRFVPYLGVGIAAVFAAALAFAVDPGWSLALSTLGIFIGLDIIVGQLLEPHLYGHATGLSPLSVVVAAIFWSWLWGPVGLLLSTPLTLCLLVAGRHMQGLGILELLLGNDQPLTLPQRFYQRALSGDPHEIIASAREFLKRDCLAAYCDRVLIPALQLARLDAEAGATTEAQHMRIRRVIVDVAAALSSDSLKLPRRRHRGAVLAEVNAGHWLRQQREQLSGRWQGPLGVPAGSLIICMGVGTAADDLSAELLVRLLRKEAMDARHFSPADIEAGLPPGADPDGVAIIFLVSAFPTAERERADSLIVELRALLPHANLIKVFCPGMTAPSTSDDTDKDEATVGSFADAIQIAESWQKVRNAPPTKAADARAAWTLG